MFIGYFEPAKRQSKTNYFVERNYFTRLIALTHEQRQSLRTCSTSFAPKRPDSLEHGHLTPVYHVPTFPRAGIVTPKARLSPRASLPVPLTGGACGRRPARRHLSGGASTDPATPPVTAPPAEVLPPPVDRRRAVLRHIQVTSSPRRGAACHSASALAVRSRRRRRPRVSGGSLDQWTH